MAAPAWGGWRLADAAFFAALALAGLLLYRTLAPVLVPVVLGAFAAVLARPSEVRLAGWLGGRVRLAAALTTLGVVLLVLLPAAFVGWMLAQEAVAAARWIAARVADDGLEGITRRLPPRWAEVLPPE